MRAFADPHVDMVVLLLASQMGKTEAGFNVLGWMWDSFPSPSMWLCPTEKLARTLSRDRIETMLQTAPNLWPKVDKRYAKPGSMERWVAGCRFGMAWSGSKTEMASHPVKYLFVDELSRMEEEVGNEGSPLRIASARVKNYPGSKIGVFSSPTEEGLCATYREWLGGTRMRWCWRCPHCGEWLFPSLAHARYPDKAPYAVIREESWIECPSCAHQIRDDDRPALEADYIPTVVDDDGHVSLAPGLETRNSVASFWATGFASLVTGIGRIMEQYARAARDGAHGDLKSVVQTWAGELWKQPGQGAVADTVRDCQIDGIPNDTIRMVTAGVDVQQDSIYFVVRGWGVGTTSYLLAHEQLLGSTEYDDVWVSLAAVLGDTFCGHSIKMVLIDSGYQTAMVHEWCRRQPTWSPSIGRDRLDRPFRDLPVDESPTGRMKRYGLKKWIYCADTWKSWLMSRLHWPKDQPGAWFVPLGVDDEYCRQVVAERWRITKGKREWYKVANDNHYLDAEVLASVAAHIMNVRALRPSRQPTAASEQPAPEPVRQAPQRPSSSFDRRGL